MKIKTPSFWYAPPEAQPPWQKILVPLSWLYAWIVRQRFDLYYPIPLSKPVVCVGNLVAGGAGKTPVVLSLVRLLKERGHNPHALTRGYGGGEIGPIQVAPSRDTSEDVGDEALLLVDAAPTWVSRNRALGAQAAIDSGANIVVMDDGFQNPVIYRDFSLVVVDSAAPFGNGGVMPAGPLRENPARGLARADAVVVLGQAPQEAIARLTGLRADLKIFTARLVPSAAAPPVSGQRIYAFAGIGRPAKFRKTLEEAGAIIEGWGEYPDHYMYKPEDLAPLVQAAEKSGSMIITTAKDHVRLPPAFKDKIAVYGVDVVWDDAAGLVDYIDATLKTHRSRA
jgi:tetraacyldisaccharide 4'-kinase